MTLSTTASYSGPSTSDGVATVYGYGFKIVDKSHLRVTALSSATVPVETVLTVDTDYTVTGIGVETGGTVVLTTSGMAKAPAGYSLYRERVVPLSQDASFENNGEFFADSVEDALDMLAMQNQQQQEQLDRAIKTTPIGATADELVFAILQSGQRDLGVSAANPATRADTSALQAGDHYFNSLAAEERKWDGAAWKSYNLPNTSPSNFFAANPVLATTVTYYLGDPGSIITGFSPSLAAAKPRFFRFASLGGNTDYPIIKNDGGATWLTLRRGDGSQIMAGELGPAGHIVDAIEYDDSVVVLNPYETVRIWYPVIKVLTTTVTPTSVVARYQRISAMVYFQAEMQVPRLNFPVSSNQVIITGLPVDMRAGVFWSPLVNIDTDGFIAAGFSHARAELVAGASGPEIYIGVAGAAGTVVATGPRNNIMRSDYMRAGTVDTIGISISGSYPV